MESLTENQQDTRPYRAAMFGTFDIENYGDLLFPLIARAQLAARLGDIELVPYSYHARRRPRWYLDVEAIQDFAAAAGSFDAVLIGGGHIIRFDKGVAYAYQPPNAAIHHPTGYWLAPALIAQQRDIPVFWNAPGFHGEIPAWGKPLLRLAVENCSHACVRDRASVAALHAAYPDLHLPLVPDSAFGLPLLVDPAAPSAEFRALRERLGLTKPYVFIQAAQSGMEFVQALVARQPEAFADLQFVAAPIGRGVGDHIGHFPAEAPNLVKLEDFPGPLPLAELIANAEGAIGGSYHLLITALNFGVPFFSTVSLSRGKLEDFGGWPGTYTLPLEGEIYPQWVRQRLGRRAVSAQVLAARAASAAYWDEVAATLRHNGTHSSGNQSSGALNRYWMGLPLTLEAAEEEAALLRQRLAAAEQRVKTQAGSEAEIEAKVEAEIAARVAARAAVFEARLAAQAAEAARHAARADAAEVALNHFRRSHSMRITAPLRALNHARLVLQGKG
jgi:lipopolysaccharide transport system ATP-binding protein